MAIFQVMVIRLGIHWPMCSPMNLGMLIALGTTAEWTRMAIRFAQRIRHDNSKVEQLAQAMMTPEMFDWAERPFEGVV
jgi:hypothetical protein